MKNTRHLPRLLVSCVLTWALAGSAFAAPPKAAASAKTVQGIVSQVTDGDTLWLKPADGKPIEVRLRDIDAPEICQPWGEESRKALSELALNKVASLQVFARDTYGRAVGTLMIEETNVSRFMVENGHAWSTRSKWDQGPLVKQEKMARALTRGLHSQGGAIQPWEWRRSRGSCQAGQAAAAPAETPATAAPRPAKAAAVSPSFSCDGRKHCSQMTSCEEAKYFVAHCPGVKMDGNHDGQPCEKQWCGRK